MTVKSISLQRQSVQVGWALYILVALAALCLPLSIAESRWLPGAERLIWVVLFSLCAGFLLGRSPFPNGLAWITGLAIGLTVSVHYASGLAPSLGMLLSDVGALVGWVWRAIFAREWLAPLPASRTLQHMLTQASTAFYNVSEWAAAVQAGLGSEDLTVLWLLTTFITWGVCWYAGFELMRTQRALVALLPLGAAVVSNVAVTYIGLGYVHIFTALMLVILVYMNVTRLQAIWERLGLDFSTELRRDTLIAGSAIAIGVLIFALLMPYATYNRAVYFFWDRYGPSLQAFYDRLDRAFAGRDPVPDPPPGMQEQISRGLLPHDVGLGSDLSENVVMLVTLSDPPPPPFEELEEMAAASGMDPRQFVERRYWRQRTYDIYTGSGWDTSERNITDLEAGEPWQVPDYPRWVVTQTFTLIEPRSNIVYAVNAPVSVDQDYRVIHRGEDDLIGIALDALEYTVVSYVPQPDIDMLQAAEDEYPEEIAARYLPLPEIPQRVVDLAWEVVEAAGAQTRYEKARAIESYLRRFAYDLDVEPPPLDTDITDYFLFDVQRGYCDYSASAMVVMLRAVGVAARYASGYGMGQYDYARERWVVTGMNAHAWAEVYFPGLGWIEFEPTPTELPRQFAGTLGGPFVPPEWPQPPTPVEAEAPRFPIWIAALLLGLTVAFVVIWPIRYLRRGEQDPREIVRRTYAKLVSRARWLNLEPRGGQTPQEYLAYMVQEMAVRGSLTEEDLQAIALIGRLYLKARYSQSEISEEEGYRALGAWRQLRGRLTRLLFTRPPERVPA